MNIRDWDAGRFLLDHGKVMLDPSGEDIASDHWVEFTRPRRLKTKFAYRMRASYRGRTRSITVKAPLTRSRLLAAADGLLMEVEG